MIIYITLQFTFALDIHSQISGENVISTARLINKIVRLLNIGNALDLRTFQVHYLPYVNMMWYKYHIFQFYIKFPNAF